jgi:hypothetical protein
MTAEHFRQLVEEDGRPVHQIARDTGVPHHHIAYYMRPSTTLARMPPDRRVVELARALDVPVERVRAAFAADLVGGQPSALSEVRERELIALYREMDPRYRHTLMQMARSLSHLERAVSRDDTPETGDGHQAM